MTYLETSSRCTVCGTSHAACGQGGDVTPVDIPTVETRMPSPLRLYTVMVNGYETRMRLDDTDAERLGASLVDGPTEEPAPEPEQPEPPKRKARAKVPNRARTADDNK